MSEQYRSERREEKPIKPVERAWAIRMARAYAMRSPEDRAFSLSLWGQEFCDALDELYQAIEFGADVEELANEVRRKWYRREIAFYPSSLRHTTR